MNIISVLLDPTIYRWFVAVWIAQWGLTLTVLPLVVFIHRLMTRSTDRREAAEKSARDLTIAAAAAPTLNVLKTIRREIPHLRLHTNVSALELACAHRNTELYAAHLTEETGHIATALASLQLPAPTTAEAVALRANVQAQQQFIENFAAGLQQMPALARRIDRLSSVVTPKQQPWVPHHPNASPL